jgi:glycosyltransferase involved in cell wall biosynthesis
MRTSSTDGLRIVHFGNYSLGGGGIASVLRQYTAWQWPRTTHEARDTYEGARRSKGLLRLLPALLTILVRRARIDVAHVHLSERGSFVREGSVVLLCAALEIPTVVTIHGASFQTFRSRCPRLVRAVLDRADLVVSLYEEMAEDLASTGISAPVAVVPNAVNVVPRRDANPLGPPRVVFAGELSSRKGIDTLLDAWPLVRREVAATLHVFGPVTDEFQDRLRTKPLPPGVFIHGACPHADVLEQMSRASLFVLPSRAEAFPMAILEAMAIGLPVVATKVAGIPDMLPPGSQLVPPEDVDQLAASLVRFLRDEHLLRNAGATNRMRQRQLYSPDVVMQELESHYLRVVRGERVS